MTKDEIKQTYSMADIVTRYGFRPDRNGFIHCPFHIGDKNASLKIYKDSFYCFGCGAGGDVITFIMNFYSSVGNTSGLKAKMKHATGQETS